MRYLFVMAILYLSLIHISGLAGGGELLDQASSLLDAGSMAAGDGHIPPKTNHNESYNASLSGTVSEGHSKLVGEMCIRDSPV